MSLSDIFARKNLYYAAAALLVAVGTTPAIAQQGIVSDWSTHHVKFANLGTEADAQANGTYEQWKAFNANPRYRAQIVKQSEAWANRFAHAPEQAISTPRHVFERSNNIGASLPKGSWTSTLSGSGTAAGKGTVEGTFPAENDFNGDAASCTSDYIAFPVEGNWTSTSKQASLVVYNHLYVNSAKTGYCSGITSPTVASAYYVTSPTYGGIYSIEGSPVLSEDGTQLAFVVNDSTYSYFRLYVLTLEKIAGTLTSGGTVSAPIQLTALTTEAKAVGTAASGTASNGAAYRVIVLGSSTAQSLTSPYVDFANNVAYVTGNGGYLWKVSNVFGTTAMSEVRLAQPTGGTATLSSPVQDPVTGNIIVGAGPNVYCVTSTGAACGGTAGNSKATFIVATTAGNPASTTNANGTLVDAPIVVDNGNAVANGKITGWVFAQAPYITSTSTAGTTGRNPTAGTASANAYAVLAQAPITSSVGTTGSYFGTPTGKNMGVVTVSATYTTTGNHTPAITLNDAPLYSGDFDNEYYSSDGTSYSGYMYFCGYKSVNDTGLITNAVTYNTIPELWRIAVTPSGSSAGTITGSSSAIYTLASNNTGTQTSGCTPLTEYDNAPNTNPATQPVDYMFLGVSGYGAPAGCTGDGCVMSFVLPSNGTAPSGVAKAYSLGSSGATVTGSSSGMVIDNSAPPSKFAGASQIYFSNLLTGDATGISQANLD